MRDTCIDASMRYTMYMCIPVYMIYTHEMRVWSYEVYTLWDTLILYEYDIHVWDACIRYNNYRIPLCMCRGLLYGSKGA